MTDDKNEGRFWFDRLDQPHRRLQSPRLFKLLSLIRRSGTPDARRELGLSDFEWRVMSQYRPHRSVSLIQLLRWRLLLHEILFPQRGSSAPRITVNSGAKINVMVARTLDFSSMLDARR